MKQAVRQAFELLKHGAVQPTRSFAPYVNTNAHPYVVRARILTLLRKLDRDLKATESPWELKRLSGHGQPGLYQLVKRSAAGDNGKAQS